MGARERPFRHVADRVQSGGPARASPALQAGQVPGRRHNRQATDSQCHVGQGGGRGRRWGRVRHEWRTSEAPQGNGRPRAHTGRAGRPHRPGAGLRPGPRGVGTAIVGTANPEHMLANIEAIDRHLPISEEVVAELQSRFDRLGGDWPGID